jgi:hypothetical protein
VEWFRHKQQYIGQGSCLNLHRFTMSARTMVGGTA